MATAPTPETKSKRPGAILFMCGFNSIRSPMAEAIAKRLLPHDIYIQSAGVRAGERDPFVDAVLEEVGLSIGRHQPRTLDELEDDFFDLIVTLTPEAHHSALELTRSNAVDVVYWPTMDPTAATGTRDQTLDAYREVRDHLWRLIEQRLSGLNRRSAETA
ncbi:protein-tyrosine-phosphatase [Neorhizobium sp. R1-B]|jgi:protein-tyrosine-phosphatase|uniref:arsenate-mycothiol transferase ArsC n=1 Tax=Neorhizobium TaxID=1525371 RepID=UPI000CF87322|nr:MULTISPECIES: low molecular weight phosphatase family protein [Neorhizobium]TCV76034.1 protein-tyrosine-phosphatase [Neorhizobium sp. S3-V5DH]TDX88977.1 protein-tyrosine-phosphatase [Neorhizobium sp. R1-B]